MSTNSVIIDTYMSTEILCLPFACKHCFDQTYETTTKAQQHLQTLNNYILQKYLQQKKSLITKPFKVRPKVTQISLFSPFTAQSFHSHQCMEVEYNPLTSMLIILIFFISHQHIKRVSGPNTLAWVNFGHLIHNKQEGPEGPGSLT